jgi:hypothetical protein
MSNDFVPPGGPAPAGPPRNDPSRPGPDTAGYPVPAPYGTPTAAAPIHRPKAVDVAFWLFLAAAAVSVVSLIVSIASFDDIRAQALRRLEDQGQGDVLPPEAVDGVMWATFAFGSVVALLFAAVYVVFAMLIRRGYGWPRFVLGACAVLAVLGLFLGGLGLGALQALCLAAGTVLVFLPASNAYFRSTAEARSARVA